MPPERSRPSVTIKFMEFDAVQIVSQTLTLNHMLLNLNKVYVLPKIIVMFLLQFYMFMLNFTTCTDEQKSSAFQNIAFVFNYRKSVC